MMARGRERKEEARSPILSLGVTLTQLIAIGSGQTATAQIQVALSSPFPTLHEEALKTPYT